MGRRKSIFTSAMIHIEIPTCTIPAIYPVSAVERNQFQVERADRPVQWESFAECLSDCILESVSEMALRVFFIAVILNFAKLLSTASLVLFLLAVLVVVGKPDSIPT